MPTITYRTLNADAIPDVNEFRKHLITWAQNQATGQRTQAAMAERKRTTDHHQAKSESYDFMIKYLQEMEIKE